MNSRDTLFIRTGNVLIDRAARIATGDIQGNLIPYMEGILERPEICAMAGLDYDTPWTRDASINTQFYLAAAEPEAARHTLMAVLMRRDGQVYIDGQYWDKIIWALGARSYCLFHPEDADFRALAAQAVLNTLTVLEAEEYDAADGLFRGPAVYGDGVAAYPDRYGDTRLGSSGILDWTVSEPDRCAPRGYGIPMKTLSTNLVYAEAYEAAAFLVCPEAGMDAGSFDAQEASLPATLRQKASALRQAVRDTFWDPERRSFDYLVDPWGRCHRAEALGLAFALLWGGADEGMRRQILSSTYVSPLGIPVVYPGYERYDRTETREGQSFRHYGRHCGVIWPHAQGYWAVAMRRAGAPEKMWREMETMAEKAVKYGQFYEIYHPETGEPYGGLQERGDGEKPIGIGLWGSCQRQTWSATGYWAALLYGLMGIRASEEGLEIRPWLPEGMDEAELSGLIYGEARVEVSVRRRRPGEAPEHPSSILLPPGRRGTIRCMLEVE